MIYASPPPEPSTTDAITSSPILVWAGILAGTFVVLAAAFPKILGPISEALSDWLEASRARAAAKDDADIVEREREKAYLQGIVDALRAELAHRDRLIAIHTAWDYEMLEGRNPPYLDPIPPLYPAPSSVGEVVRFAQEGD